MLLLAIAVAMAGVAGIVTMQESRSFHRPERMNVVLHHDATKGETVWLAEPIGRAPLPAGTVRTDLRRATPWDRAPGFVPVLQDTAATHELAPAHLVVKATRAEGRGTRIRITIKAPRGTDRLVIGLPGDFAYEGPVVGVNGQEIALPSLETRGAWRTATIIPPPPEGLEFMVTVHPPESGDALADVLRISLAGWRTGLPDPRIAEQLRGPTFVTGRAGDRSVTLTEHEIPLR